MLSETPKPVKCVIVDSKFVYGLQEGEDGTPAVAVPMADYREVRRMLAWVSELSHDDHARSHAQSALKLLPEVPDA